MSLITVRQVLFETTLRAQENPVRTFRLIQENVAEGTLLFIDYGD